MSITQEFKNAAVGARDALAGDGRRSGTPDVVRHMRYEHPYETCEDDIDGILALGWSVAVSGILRSIKTDGGERTLVSVRNPRGRSYEQLRFVTLEDAMSVLQMYESQEQASRVQRRGWAQIVARLAELPEGSTVGAIFTSEQAWDDYWQAVRASDLGGA